MKEKKHQREEEEKYFQRENQAKTEDLRRQRQLKALRQQERAQIASALETSEAVAEEAMALGFDAQTARVLPLVPLSQVAWAVGNIPPAQAEEVLDKAKAFGVIPDTPAHEFLSLLLEQEPSQAFFKRVQAVIKGLVENQPGTDMTANVLGWSRAVAESSGGFFGLTNPISKKERAALDEIAAIFDN